MKPDEVTSVEMARKFILSQCQRLMPVIEDYFGDNTGGHTYDELLLAKKRIVSVYGKWRKELLQEDIGGNNMLYKHFDILLGDELDKLLDL
jgi:hypothetical protein